MFGQSPHLYLFFCARAVNARARLRGSMLHAQIQRGGQSAPEKSQKYRVS